MKIKIGDTVQFIAGKERHAKNRTGKVIKTIKDSNRIVVEGKNIRTKHVKKTEQEPGKKITFEASINASNVLIICPKCSKPTRVGYKKLEDGKKQRICKKCNESLDSAVPNIKVKSKA